MMLHLWQIKVRSTPPLDELMGIVEKVESEIKDRAGEGLAVDLDAGFVEVPAAGTVNTRVAQKLQWSGIILPRFVRGMVMVMMVEENGET